MWLEDPAPSLNVVASTDLPLAKPIIALHPGSGSLKKNWPVEHWIRVHREAVIKHPHYHFALITGEAETERGITAEITAAWSDLDYLHWDQLPLTELASRLAACRGFIGHDSGISHLAADCGVPCQLFFGPTDPATWAPRNAAVRVTSEPTGDLALMDFLTGWSEVDKFLAYIAEDK